MLPIQLFDPVSSTYTYLLFDDDTGDALIIDPVDEQLEREMAVLSQYGLKLGWTLGTHAHADRITSAGKLAEHCGAKTAVPAGCGIGSAAVQLKHGDVLAFGGEEPTALHTPGHTAGGMSYLWSGNAFTGDTLLINVCGHIDFQSGSAGVLHRSLTDVSITLPPETLVWPGRDYQGQSHSTIGLRKPVRRRLPERHWPGSLPP